MTLRTRSHEYKFKSRFASTQTYEDTLPFFLKFRFHVSVHNFPQKS